MKIKINEVDYSRIKPYSSIAAKHHVNAKDSRSTLWYMATDGEGRDLGFKGIMFKANGIARFKGFLVFPKFQGKGIGQNLIEHCEEVCEKRMCAGIETFTYNRARFEKRGYKHLKDMANGASVMLKRL